MHIFITLFHEEYFYKTFQFSLNLADSISKIFFKINEFIDSVQNKFSHFEKSLTYIMNSKYKSYLVQYLIAFEVLNHM